MAKQFRELDIKSLDGNLFSLLDDDWMLITAGNLKEMNTMTASWGGFGILWNKPVAFIFIRPQRHTLNFVRNEDYFTLSFFEEEFRNILKFCGSASGRNINKIAETGLTAVKTPHDSIYFQQARLVMECRKLYDDQIRPEGFIIKELEKKIYRDKDYHHMFIAGIVSCLIKD